MFAFFRKMVAQSEKHLICMALGTSAHKTVEGCT